MKTQIDSNDWAIVTLDQCGELYCGQSASVAEVNTQGRGHPYFTGPEQWDGAKLHVNKWTEHPRRLVPDGCIFITVKGAGVGKIFPGTAGAIGRDIYAYRVHDAIEFKYVYYALKLTVEQIVAHAKGDIPGLSRNHIVDHKIILPSIHQQQRVVARIDELFSELDKGVECLMSVQAQLKAYRQAVLKHAFEGKLTANWRNQSKGRWAPANKLRKTLAAERQAQHKKLLAEWELKLARWKQRGSRDPKPSRPRSLDAITPLTTEVLGMLPAIPEGWVWEKLGWMTCGVDYGTAAKSSRAGSIPVVRMGNLQNGQIDWSDLVYTDDAKEIAQYQLTAGDVLFNRTNSPELVGKTAIYMGEHAAIFAGYLIRVNHNTDIVDGRYLNLFLNSHLARQYGNTVKTDGVNQSNINGEKLQGYPFPFCSLDEQCEIVRLLDEKLSSCDHLIREVEYQLGKAHTLRLAILNKAFSGLLVKQEPGDESASVLLERIQAVTEKSSKNGKNTKNKRKEAA